MISIGYIFKFLDILKLSELLLYENFVNSDILIDKSIRQRQGGNPLKEVGAKGLTCSK